MDNAQTHIDLCAREVRTVVFRNDHGEAVVFVTVDSASNNGVDLFFTEMVFGGAAISTFLRVVGTIE